MARGAACARATAPGACRRLLHGESVAAAERLGRYRPAFHAGSGRALHQQPGRVNQAQVQGQGEGLKVVQQR